MCEGCACVACLGDVHVWGMCREHVVVMSGRGGCGQRAGCCWAWEPAEVYQLRACHSTWVRVACVCWGGRGHVGCVVVGASPRSGPTSAVVSGCVFSAVCVRKRLWVCASTVRKQARKQALERYAARAKEALSLWLHIPLAPRKCHAPCTHTHMYASQAHTCICWPFLRPRGCPQAWPVLPLLGVLLLCMVLLSAMLKGSHELRSQAQQLTASMDRLQQAQLDLALHAHDFGVCVREPLAGRGRRVPPETLDALLYDQGHDVRGADPVGGGDAPGGLGGGALGGAQGVDEGGEQQAGGGLEGAGAPGDVGGGLEGGAQGVDEGGEQQAGGGPEGEGARNEVQVGLGGKASVSGGAQGVAGGEEQQDEGVKGLGAQEVQRRASMPGGVQGGDEGGAQQGESGTVGARAREDVRDGLGTGVPRNVQGVNKGSGKQKREVIDATAEEAGAQRVVL